MKPEMFLGNFEMLADAPNGVEKLRELILQLAISGKLVPQNSNDEIASKLLERVTQKREDLLKKKKVTRRRSSPIQDDEIPFDLPNNWEWACLADISHDWGQKKPDVEFTYIDVSSINKELGVISDSIQVLQPSEAPSRARKLVEEGTVIYSTVRPYLLNIAIIDKTFDPEPIVSTAFGILHPFDGIINRFIYFYLRSQPFIEYVENEMTGMAYPAINDGKLFKGLIPIPPTEEQRRIVAKVDELMALCEKLEARQQKCNEVRVHLNTASLNRLTSVSDPDEFSASWQRICENFDLLYDHPENIKEFRQAIFYFACSGKLTEKWRNQHSSIDSFPSSDLFYEEDETITNDLVNLPSTWNYIQIGQLGKIVGGGTPSKSKSVYWEGDIPWVSPKDMKVDRIQKSINTITEIGVENSAVKMIPKNSLLFVVRGMILLHTLPVALSAVDITINQDMKAVVLKEPSISDYLLIAAKYVAPQILSRVKVSSHGTRRLDTDSLRYWPLPIPPIEEQKIIVSEVQKLMNICDELENRLLGARSEVQKIAALITNRLTEN
jgi:type I restriction enzyme, S subunit